MLVVRGWQAFFNRWHAFINRNEIETDTDLDEVIANLAPFFRQLLKYE